MTDKLGRGGLPKNKLKASIKGLTLRLYFLDRERFVSVFEAAQSHDHINNKNNNLVSKIED